MQLLAWVLTVEARSPCTPSVCTLWLCKSNVRPRFARMRVPHCVRMISARHGHLKRKIWSLKTRAADKAHNILRTDTQCQDSIDFLSGAAVRCCFMLCQWHSVLHGSAIEAAASSSSCLMIWKSGFTPSGGFHTWNSWMVYSGKSYQNGWFRGTPILGNPVNDSGS